MQTRAENIPLSAVPEASPERTQFAVLGGISVAHMLNDMIQSLILAIYPLLKSDFHLSFAQVGLITLTYQLTASLLQPLVGMAADRRPMPYSLAAGMGFTLAGLLLLATAPNFPVLLLAAALVGTGSSIFHPESSRVARMASGGRPGLAQSVFVVGGNFGASLGPLLAAWIIVPHGRGSVAWFALGPLLRRFGYKTVLTVGAGAQAVRFLVFAWDPGATVVIVSLALHGVAFACFFTTAILYIERASPPGVRHSAQTVFGIVLFGLGPALAGPYSEVFDHFTRDGRPDFRMIWYTQAAVALASAVAIVLLFRDRTRIGVAVGAVVEAEHAHADPVEETAEVLADGDARVVAVGPLPVARLRRHEHREALGVRPERLGRRDQTQSLQAPRPDPRPVPPEDLAVHEGGVEELCRARAVGDVLGVLLLEFRQPVVPAEGRADAREPLRRAVLVAAEGERGVFRFDGRMVDEPVLRHARAILARV